MFDELSRWFERFLVLLKLMVVWSYFCLYSDDWHKIIFCKILFIFGIYFFEFLGHYRCNDFTIIICDDTLILRLRIFFFLFFWKNINSRWFIFFSINGFFIDIFPKKWPHFSLVERAKSRLKFHFSISQWLNLSINLPVALSWGLINNFMPDTMLIFDQRH